MQLHPILSFFSVILLDLWKLRLVAGICEISNALGASPIVELTSGAVQGLSCISALGLPYFSFRGIPYAEPPLAELRFRPPRPPSKWEGVLQATTEPPACSQPWQRFPYPITYSEDCLYLKVFTPNLTPFLNKQLPVMFWVHGGLHYREAGATALFGPDFLLEKDVILVTINYRLGVFGFLNMNTTEAQGNAALKDMVAALKWVRREIHNFGGDPELVTIFGDSSGAEDVNLIYLSQMAKGLFSRAISHSGSAFRPGDFKESTLQLGLELGRALGCHSNSPSDVVACLRTVDAQELAEKQMMFEGYHGRENPFRPTVEMSHGDEVFLPEDPITLLAWAPDVPYIMGLTSGEGLMYIKDPGENLDLFTDLENKMIKYLPSPILDTENQRILEFSVTDIEHFYFQNTSTLINTIYHFSEYMGDKQICYSVLKTAQQLSLRSKVYLYYFSFLGDFLNDNDKLNMSLIGVNHEDDLGYLFYRNYTLPAHNDLLNHQRELAMVDKVTTLWADFATYGNPTPFSGLWQPVNGRNTGHLIIDENILMISSPLFADRVAFWDGLYTSVSNMLNLTSPFKNKSNIFLVLAPFMILFIVICILTFTLSCSKRKNYVSLK